MANFLGFKQTTLAAYLAAKEANAESVKNYLWLVRDGDTVDGKFVPNGKNAIYFGTRLYAEVNLTAEELNDMLDEKADASAVTSAITALQEAINEKADETTLNQKVKELQDSINKKADAEELKNAVDEVSSALTQMQEDIDKKADEDKVNSALTEMQEDIDKKADADNVYTKDEIDGKLSGLWHFKGEVADKDALPTDAKEGDVYQVTENGKEFAWNGSEWVELGFNVDLSNYATKEFVNSAISEEDEALKQEIKKVGDAAASAITEEEKARKDADSALTKDIEDVKKDVEALEEKATITLKDYEVAEAVTGLSQGQIVYLQENWNDGIVSESTPSGTTYYAGAYIVTSVNEDGTANFMKLQASDASGASADEKIAALQTRVVADEARIKTLEDDATHTISGNDVE